MAQSNKVNLTNSPRRLARTSENTRALHQPKATRSSRTKPSAPPKHGVLFLIFAIGLGVMISKTGYHLVFEKGLAQFSRELSIQTEIGIAIRELPLRERSNKARVAEAWNRLDEEIRGSELPTTPDGGALLINW